MNKTTLTNRIGMVALLGVTLVASILFAGCDKPEKKPTPAPKTEKTPAVDEKSRLAEVAACKDMMAWYTLRSEYETTGTRHTNVDAALSAKESQLLEKTPPKLINDSLELVAFDWESEGDDHGEGERTKFTITWLFRKTAPIEFAPEHKVKLILRGAPAKEDQHYIEEKDRAYNQPFFELTYELEPSIDVWAEGEYHMVTRRTNQASVAYRMRTFFSEVIKRDDRWRYFGLYGEEIDIGWYVDLGE